MIGTRRIRSAYLLCSLLVLAASLHAPTAYSAPGDPPSGSPAGAVYQLPLEQGRSDAAPKGNGGTGTGDGGAGAPTGGDGSGNSGGRESSSLYRSENNFGSSSRVPGLAATGGAGGAAGSAAGAAAGAGATEAAGAAAAGGAIAAKTADTGNTSVAAGVLLLAAIGLLAAAAGVLSRRLSAGRAGS